MHILIDRAVGVALFSMGWLMRFGRSKIMVMIGHKVCAARRSLTFKVIENLSGLHIISLPVTVLDGIFGSIDS